MYKTCSTELSALRQQQLEDCLLKNMLVKPYTEISISELCQQASISRKSFYRYFGNKDDCLCALLDRVLMASSQSTVSGQPEPNNLEEEFVQILSFWKTQSDLLSVLISNDLTDLLLARMIQYITQEERSFLKYIGILDEIGDDDFLLFSLTGFLSVLLNWANNGFRKPVSQMAAIFTELFTQPLMSVVPQD